MSDDLVQEISDLNEDRIMSLVEEKIEKGQDPKRVLDECRKGITKVGERYEQKEYFLPELMLAGEVLDDVMALIKPELKGGDSEEEGLGKVLIATVQGDIHDIGSGIVSFVLEINGFDVHNIGVDVPPEEIVDNIKELKPEVVGLSAFLTTAIDDLKETIEVIDGEGLREDVRIMIGGAPINQEVTEHVGADDWGEDAMEAVRLAKKWVGVN